MRKTRVTTKGATVRRDSYYIDPASGYAFCSIRDVDRYLESGEIGRNTFKPKDCSDMKLKADNSSSVGVTSTPTLSPSMGLSSDLDMVASDKLVQKPARSRAYVYMPVSENISTQLQLQADGSDLKEGKVGLTKTASVPGCTDEESQELQENEQPKHVSEKSQVRQRKRHKREFNLPRRSSKRLAGIQIDPVPELITRNRRRRAVVKQSANGEMVANDDEHSKSLPNAAAKHTFPLDGCPETKCKSESTTTTVESPKSCQSRHLYGEFSTPERGPEKTKEMHGSDKDQECFSFWPQKNHSATKDNMRVIGDKVDAMLDHYSHEFSLRELLKDPCIAFAVQILTEVTFDSSITSQDFAQPRNSEHSETLVAMRDAKGNCNVFPHPENYAIPQKHGGIENKTIKNTGFLHTDPCIEFAIKTLTGNIPFDSQQNPKNCIQQQLSSSNSHHGEIALPSVSLDNIRQTDYFHRQIFCIQKPMFDQNFLDPTLQHTPE